MSASTQIQRLLHRQQARATSAHEFVGQFRSELGRGEERNGSEAGTRQSEFSSATPAPSSKRRENCRVLRRETGPASLFGLELAADEVAGRGWKTPILQQERARLGKIATHGLLFPFLDPLGAISPVATEKPYWSMIWLIRTRPMACRMPMV